MNRRGHTRLCVLLLGLVAGCQSTENAEGFQLGRSLPYQIYVYVDVPPMPVDENSTGDEDSGPIPVNVERIESEILVDASPLKLYTEVIPRGAVGQDIESVMKEARNAGADLVLHVECREPKYSFSHRSAWFLPNTLLWFVLGFPSFYVPDRVYEVEWVVQYHLYAANGKLLVPEKEFTTLNTHVPLSVVDREFSVEALYTPPGFFVGSITGQKLKKDAEDLLIRDTILKLTSIQPSQRWENEIEIASPANLSSVRADETDVIVRIAGRANLLRLRLELDNKVLAERDVHSMSGLVKTRELRDGSRVYEWKRPLAEILTDGETRPSRFTDWNATRTITFKTQHDDRTHFFRVLALTSPSERSAVASEEP